MTSLVAPKRSDGPTSPGLMSFGSDPAALDDYLNLDLFGARTSHSPASSHSALPMTPGTGPGESSTAALPALDQSPGGSLAFVDSYTPLDKTFGAFPDLPGLGGDLALSGGLDQYSSLFQDMFPTFSDPASGPSASVIDPQLFTAQPPAPAAEPSPAPPAAAPTPATVDSDNDEDEAQDDMAPLPATRTTGRRPKKNAAAAGGIAKRPSRSSTPASVVPSYLQFEDPKPVIPPALGKGGVASYLNGERIGSQEPDEWRPTPEEYKKLSSKEKRQLRNKISARNFRVRRKEYITTLESHIADRDQLIAAIRSELSLTHNENNELRREIDALKRAIQEGRLSAEATGLPPPRPLSPDGQPSTCTAAPRRPTDLARANTQKDRSSDPSARSFWGGAVGHGGVTSVHTTLIPEMFPAAPQLSGKPSPARNLSPQSSSPMSSASPTTPPNEGVNMNPLMNLSPLFGSSKLPTTPPVHLGLDVMDQEFNQRTLDGFRAQLWGRMAKEAGARSVQLERRVSEGLPGSEGPTSPSQTLTPSPQQSSASSSQQSVQDSVMSPPMQTISSSPSLSMLNQPGTLRSLVESATGRWLDGPSLFQSPIISPPLAPASASTPAPALLQASSFGAGFLGSASSTASAPSTSAFAQNVASIQARAMLQAQWLALQQSRQTQNTAASSSGSTQAANQSAAQRDMYLAQFAHAAAAQQQQLQLQQQQQQQALGGRAGDVRPAYFAPSSSKPAKAGSEKKLSALEKMSLGDTKTDKETKGTTPQQAAFVATLASQTLLQRMGSAFWDAFSGGNLKGDVDTDKVRRVLEGKAVVRVVDLDEDARRTRREVGVEALEEKMRAMSVGGGSSGSADCASAAGVFSNLRGKK